jgi:predicted DNA-binding protein (MmcQ/YjbR family)
MSKPVSQLLKQARKVCLALPDAAEQETWGHPTFRVGDKIFATFGIGDEEGETTMSMKAPAGEQEVLLATGEPFFYPKYVGSKGWIGVTLGDSTDWQEMAELAEDSYREIAPKRLVKQLDVEQER